MIKRFFVAVALCAAAVCFSASPAKAQATWFYVATAVDVQGSESVFSNEVSAIVPLQGTHTVALTCTEPVGSAVGFNFYRGKVSGGPYARQNSVPTTACAFTDKFSAPPAPVLAPPVVN